MASESSGVQWQWPSGMDTERRAPTSASDSIWESDSAGGQAPNPQPAPAPKRRRYKPRTCRICLEVVQPTTEIDDSFGAGLFQSRTRVRYVSEDAELGRLISPCLCKGSQRYVHEGCLQAWRQSAPLSDRNFWRCPTCQFEYRLNRIKYGQWISSKGVRAAVTLGIMLLTVFLLGFVADPIINLWVDPLGSITGTLTDTFDDIDFDPLEDDEPDTWSFHFVKGFFSLGLLGFIKSFLAMSPWHWFNLRVNTRRRGTGRDRMESINWAIIIIGVFTFLGVSASLSLLLHN